MTIWNFLFSKALYSKNLDKLPLFYQLIEPKSFVNDDDDDEMDPKERSILTEFVTSSLMDPKFPAFVQTVENVLSDVLKNELNISWSAQFFNFTERFICQNT